MKIIKKFTAVQLIETTVNDNVLCKLEFGRISGTHYDRVHHQTSFDTEEEAINWAYNEDKYSTWSILPIINFIND